MPGMTWLAMPMMHTESPANWPYLGARQPSLGGCWISATLPFGGSKQESGFFEVMYSIHPGQYQMSRQSTGLLPSVGMGVDPVHVPNWSHSTAS